MIVFLSGCITPPDFATGEGCWRYGVVEGEVTRTPSTDITYLSMDEIVDVCDQVAWGCYHLISHRIFLYWGAGKMDLFEEQCHSIGFMEHNNCSGYGIGQDASACDWREG